MVLFYEYLTIRDVLSRLFHALIWRMEKPKNVVTAFYWIDASPIAAGFVAFLSDRLGIPAEKLDFQLVQTRNQDGELIRIQITRKDLYLFQNLIYTNKGVLSPGRTTSENSRLQFFLQKQLLDPNIIDRMSVSRVLYLIHVVAQSKVVDESGDRVLVLSERPWKKEYEQYAEPLGLALRWGSRRPAPRDIRRSVMSLFFKLPRLYNLLQRLRGVNVHDFDHSSSNYMFVEGRGDANLINDGKNSDFDWLLQSEFPKDRVVYLNPDAASPENLANSGIHTVSWKATQANICPENFGKDRARAISGTLSPLEKRELGSKSQEYRLQRGIWSGFFQHYGIKLFMSWYKADGRHAVMADAIRALGGISAINQVSFDGFLHFEHQVSVDLAFGFSNFSMAIERDLKSEIPYFVITGYPRDHARPFLEAPARELRDQLEQAGARKIIFSIDENSHVDVRWNPGHRFQQENYRYVLEKVLELPWLGAVFKPKAPNTLRQRLGELNELLCAAERTGRCVVLEESHYATTVEPVLLAGLAADVCIHGHLAAGTAALECALAGIPTILVDREHVPFSKLYELPRGTVVFEDWPSAMEAVMEHFESEKGVPGFGDWGDLLDELDPFRDGKASFRIGTYLKWLLEGFDRGMHRERILAEAASRYMEAWGGDKVLSIGI